MFDDAAMDQQTAFPCAQVQTALQPVVTTPPMSANGAVATNETNLPAYGMSYSAAIDMHDMPTPANLQHAVKTSEHQVIMAAIQSTDSRIEAAAKLGISPRTLRYKLAQLRERGMSEGASA